MNTPIFFVEMPYVNELEVEGKWNTLFSYLIAAWSKQKNDLDLTLRLIAECWLMLTFWKWIDHSELNEADVQNALTQAVKEGTNHFTGVPKYLCLVGFMINLFPYLFESAFELSYFEIEHLGMEMMQKACILDPENPVAKMLFLGTKPLSDENKREKTAYRQDQILHSFSGESWPDRYFRQLLCG